jgi:hypothetical protein
LATSLPLILSHPLESALARIQILKLVTEKAAFNRRPRPS